MERERAQTILRVLHVTLQGIATSTILHSYSQHSARENGIECQDAVQNEQIVFVSTSYRSGYVRGNHGGSIRSVQRLQLRRLGRTSHTEEHTVKETIPTEPGR